MKGATPIMAILAILAVVGGLMYVSGNFPGGSIGIGTCVAKEGLAVLPIMGYYECKIIDTDAVRDITIRNAGWVNCGDDEYTRKCNMEIKCPERQTWFFGLLPSNARLVYKIEGRTQFKYVNNVQSCSVGGTLINEDIYRGESFFVKLQTQDIWGNWYDVNDVDINIRERWTKWGLWRESRTGASTWINQQGCYVDFRVPDYMNICQEGDECVDGTAREKITNGELDFSQSTNFLEKWAIGPVEYNIVNHPSYGEVYCAGGSIYSTDTISLTSGCYKFPDRRLASVDCCPGEKTANAVCSDFKWSSTAQTTCISDIQCDGGSWIPDYSDSSRTTVMKGSCEDGVCEYTTKKVECSTGEACSTDEVCRDFECVKQGPVGDLPTVTIPGEDLGGIDLFGNLFGYLTMFIAALIISAISVIALAFLAFKPLLADTRKLAAIIILFALVLTIFFAAPVAMFAGSIFA